MNGPVQSVEALLDPATDDRVRALWDVLAAAGLPSQARHTGESNAPHVTLAVRDEVPGDLDGALGEAVGPLPLPVRLGGLLVFARRRCVLALAVVPSSGLLDAHARVDHALAGCGPSAPHLAPGTWTPHVTLARGLAPDQVGTAVAALGTLDDLDGTVVAVRRWDARERRTWTLPRDRAAD
jgi:2'-5' RNA ligase